MVLEQQLQDADSAQLLGISGSVVSVQGMSLRVRHLPLPLGSVVELDGLYCLAYPSDQSVLF